MGNVFLNQSLAVVLFVKSLTVRRNDFEEAAVITFVCFPDGTGNHVGEIESAMVSRCFGVNPPKATYRQLQTLTPFHKPVAKSTETICNN